MSSKLIFSDSAAILEQLASSDQHLLDAVGKLLAMPSDIQKHTIETINLLFDAGTAIR